MIIKVSIVIEDKGKILILKEWSNKKDGFYWNLVKGTFGDHEGETLEQCAIREAKEEAGIEIEVDKLISCYVYPKEVLGLQFNFLGHPKDGNKTKIAGKGEQNLRGEEITETKWITKEEVLQMNRDDFISKRIFKAIEDWSQNKSYALETLTGLD